MTDPLFFQDFLLESTALQCDWCGDIGTTSEIKPVQLDVEHEWQWVCSSCLESYDLKNSA